MRGRVDERAPLFHVFSVEDRIRPGHPLRDVKRRVDAVLAAMGAQFAAAYSRTGRPSVPPGRSLEALLLTALYSVRSERQLCERIDTDLLFRWFLDLQPSDDAFDPTAFSQNRDRLEEYRLTQAFFDAVVGRAITHGLCGEHFSADGTLIESFAAAKSFRPKDEPTGGERTPSNRGTRRWTSAGKSGRTRRTPATPTRRRGCTARASAGRRSCRTWAAYPGRIGTDRSSG